VTASDATTEVVTDTAHAEIVTDAMHAHTEAVIDTMNASTNEHVDVPTGGNMPGSDENAWTHIFGP